MVHLLVSLSQLGYKVINVDGLRMVKAVGKTCEHIVVLSSIQRLSINMALLKSSFLILRKTSVMLYNAV